MHATNVRPPQFGGKAMSDEYYVGVNGIITTLRPMATLRTIAEHLSKAQFLTPTGLPWTKPRLANYLRSASI